MQHHATKYRFTVLTGTPNELAISPSLSPFLRNSAALAGFAFVVPCRHALARAMGGTP